MPITVSKMAANAASMTITGGTLGEGNSITITYYPNKITTKALEAMGSDIVTTAQGLADIIKSWDFLEDDGGVWAVNVEHLKELGIGVLTQIRNSLIDDVRPN